MRRIAIVGGGMGGLATARFLERTLPGTCALTVFEASPRLGGKIRTVGFTRAPISFEAGVAELYYYRTFGDPLRDLVGTLGLKTVDMNGSGVILGERVIPDDAAVARVLGHRAHRQIQSFEERAMRRRPYAAFYGGGSRSDNRHPDTKITFAKMLSQLKDPDARRYLEVRTRTDLASEPHATTALYGVDNVLLDRYCSYYSIQGGIERLPEALARTLSARKLLSAPVSRVERIKGGRYRVTYQLAEKSQSENFDAVVVALPFPWLPAIHWSGERLARAMSRHVDHYNYPAHYLRITALFERPFWRRHISGSFFHHDAFGGCCLYDEGTRFDTGSHGVLSWLLAGRDALHLNSREDDELVELALSALPKVMRHGRQLFIEGRVHRWIGAVSARPGGTKVLTLKERHCPEPEEHPGLVLVGDYLFDSTINGVLDSAEIAARFVKQHLGQLA